MITIHPGELRVDKERILRYTGYRPGKRKIQGRIEKLLDEEIERARALLNPRGLYRIVDNTALKGHKLFRDAQKIAFGICTIGDKLEQEVKNLFRTGESTRGLLLDAAGSVFSEATADYINIRINDWAYKNELKITRRFSPGYSGWDVRDQGLVFDYLGKFTAGVKLTPGGVMVPLKSVSFACKLGNLEMEEINKEDKCGLCQMKNNCKFLIDG